jgi:holo-[acyl-carrier protein] synthase
VILGIGIDICDVRKLRRALTRAAFRRRVFDPVERRACERRARPEQHYAARFAAKEAYLKALGIGWSQGVGWAEVAVRRDHRGAPKLTVRGHAAQQAGRAGVRSVHLSLSHAGDYAVAMVVLEGGPLPRPAAARPSTSRSKRSPRRRRTTRGKTPS